MNFHALSMPAPLREGGFSRRALSSEGAITWLRELLCVVGIEADLVAEFGTHSAKRTLLEWAARAGMSREARLVLGGHAKGE